MQLDQTNHRRHLCCTHEYKRRPLLLLRVSDANGKWSICILGWPCLQPLGSASEVSAVNIPPTHTALDPSFMYPMLISTDDTYTRASDKLLGYTRSVQWVRSYCLTGQAHGRRQSVWEIGGGAKSPQEDLHQHLIVCLHNRFDLDRLILLIPWAGLWVTNYNRQEVS